tara:strand:- start:1113 stop:1253 length:141 start_codon:yes stop_codon:yes gene_type:complete
MVGKIILWIKNFLKQQTCLHDFIPDRVGIITGLSCGRICKKCNIKE